MSHLHLIIFGLIALSVANASIEYHININIPVEFAICNSRPVAIIDINKWSDNNIMEIARVKYAFSQFKRQFVFCY